MQVRQFLPMVTFESKCAVAGTGQVEKPARYIHRRSERSATGVIDPDWKGGTAVPAPIEHECRALAGRTRGDATDYVQLSAVGNGRHFLARRWQRHLSLLRGG